MERNSTILIVDDQQSAREVLMGSLMEQGYTLALANNGEEALAKAAELTPDLILLDVMMPGMSGYEVCRRLRADPLLAEVPVIMITALDDHDSLLQAIEAGADDFISKPFNHAELQARVRTITRLNRYRRLLLERTYRRQAEEEIYRRNYELTLLNQVITATASTLDIQDALYVACQALANAFELPQATAILLNKEQTQFTTVVEYVSPELHLKQTEANVNQLPGDILSEQIPLVGLLSEYKSLMAEVDTQTDPRLAQVHNLMYEYGLGSLLLVSIPVRDQIAGIIELKAVERHYFNKQDLTLTQSVAAAVGQAMETAQLYQDLQGHANSLEETVTRRTQELQLERDRTQAILETLEEAVVVTDTAGVIQYVNPAVAVLTGFYPVETLGQNWSLWQSESTEDYLYDQILKVVHTGQTWRGEVVNKRKDGTLYDAALTVAPLFLTDSGHQPIGFVSVQRDITPLKEAERSKDKFVSNVSHELRTPLSVITLLSDNLDTLYKRLDDDKRRKMIQDIQKHTQILNDLIGDVLEISRIDSGRISMRREPVNLAQLVNEEIYEILPIARQKSQTLQASGVDRLSVWGNQAQLRQVIRNLLNNAIKYTPNQGQISCECLLLSVTFIENGLKQESAWPGSDNLPNGRWAALRVVDSGIGISAEHLSSLFERFYRVKSQQNIRGTGLGLSITRELIELHTGHIAVASRPGQGSTFAVYLPFFEQKQPNKEEEG